MTSDKTPIPIVHCCRPDNNNNNNKHLLDKHN
jgi:hypothetical protein